MPLKTPKPKTPQQLEEILELIEWRIDAYAPCLCQVCRIEWALYMAQRDAILWALGRNPKDFCHMIRFLKRGNSTMTKHQCAHAE